MSTGQELSQAMLGALTSTLHGDKASAAKFRRELVDSFDADDVVEVAVGLMTALVLMFGPSEQTGILRELAKWVAEQDD